MIDELRVDPSNDEQRRAWDGDEGAYWAAHPDEFDNGMQDYQRGFIAACGIAPYERVLDIGCGAGQCTLEAARLAAGGHALGVDLSAARAWRTTDRNLAGSRPPGRARDQ